MKNEDELKVKTRMKKEKKRRMKKDELKGNTLWPDLGLVYWVQK